MTEDKDLKCSMDLRIKSEDDRRGETGRSMVEMLGTLAIISVLSVGGIAGFRYGMDKYHANEIVRGVSMMAVTASQGLLINSDFSLSEYGDKVAGYAYTTNKDFGGTDDRFSITVQGIEDGVCEQVKNMDWSMPYQILVNEAENGNCVDPSNIEFVFYDDLGSDENSDGENGDDTGCGVGQKSCGTSCCPLNASCRDGQCLGRGVHCKTGETPICPEHYDADCKCVPEGQTGACSKYWSACIVCEEGQAVCGALAEDPETGCQCVPEGQTGACGEETCITCEVNETAMCSRETCQCVPEGQTGACSENGQGCIVCEEGQAVCSGSTEDPETGCQCVPEGQTGACGYDFCITCDDGLQAMCPSYAEDSSECSCVPQDRKIDCGESACIDCDSDETPVCAEYGEECICVSSDKEACGFEDCISCGEGEKPMCPNYGACQCVPADKTVACRENGCIACEADETPVMTDFGSPDDERSGICITKDMTEENWACGGWYCHVCASDETAYCGGYASSEEECICVKKNETGFCGPWGSCVICGQDDTIACPYDGECVCISPDQEGICIDYDCAVCDSPQVPVCNEDKGECECCSPGQTVECDENWECKCV